MSCISAGSTRRKLLHQQCEVLGVVGRGGDTCHIAGGVLPIDVYTVQTELLYHSQAILGKCLAALVGRGHLTETTAAPTTNREHYLQLGFNLFEGYQRFKALRIVDAHTVERVGDVAKCVVDVGDVCRVGNYRTPRGDVSNHHLIVGDLFLLCLATCQQGKCGYYCDYLLHSLILLWC